MPSMRKVPSVKVNFDTTNTDIGTGSFAVSWHSTSWDTHSFWSAGNPSYITIPFDGIYLTTVTLSWLPTTTLGTFCFQAIQTDNLSAGVSWASLAQDCWDPNALGVTNSLNTSAAYAFQKGTRIRVLAQQNSGTGTDLRGSDIGFDASWMTCTFIDKWDF